MNKKILARFRTRLKDQRQNILAWLNKDSNHIAHILGNSKPEFAESIPTDNLQKTLKIDQAIDSIDKGEFGKCTMCSGEVETERLELDFTTEVCLSHYSDPQIRELENDLELAAKVQRQLLPSTVPEVPGIEIATHTEPAGIVREIITISSALEIICRD